MDRIHELELNLPGPGTKAPSSAGFASLSTLAPIGADMSFRYEQFAMKLNDRAMAVVLKFAELDFERKKLISVFKGVCVLAEIYDGGLLDFVGCGVCFNFR